MRAHPAPVAIRATRHERQRAGSAAELTLLRRRRWWRRLVCSSVVHGGHPSIIISPVACNACCDGLRRRLRGDAIGEAPVSDQLRAPIVVQADRLGRGALSILRGFDPEAGCGGALVASAQQDHAGRALLQLAGGAEGCEAGTQVRARLHSARQLRECDDHGLEVDRQALKLAGDRAHLKVAVGLVPSRRRQQLQLVDDHNGGGAAPEDIDAAMVHGYRHPIGPLRLGDLVGLDVRLAVGDYLCRELGEEQFRPPALLRQMVTEGKLGRKSGEGFYIWTN